MFSRIGQWNLVHARTICGKEGANKDRKRRGLLQFTGARPRPAVFPYRATRSAALTVLVN